MSLSNPPRYQAVALQLPKLPPEVVHTIIGDLSIQKLLEITCSYDVPYIDECICSHIYLSKIFDTQNLAKIKVGFTAYQHLRSLNRHHRHPDLKDLKVDALQFCTLHSNRPNLIDLVNRSISVGVLEELEKYKPFLDVLKVFAKNAADIPEPRFWGSMQLEEMATVFNILDQAEVRLNNLRAGQLKEMARLLREYPGTLRTRDNQTQEPLRNVEHIVDTLLYTAKRMEKRHLVSGKLGGLSIFSSMYLFLVPFDRTLWLFLKTLQRYPTDLEKLDAKHKRVHVYPKAMEVVIKGFGAIYPRESPDDKERTSLKEAPFYRTFHTKYAETGDKRRRGHHQPMFASLTLGPSERDKTESLLPAAAAELEWLAAYLEICRYMAGMEEEWKTGITVGEYWQTYYPQLGVTPTSST